MSAEAAVIGCILNEPELIKECILKSTDFQELGHIYKVMKGLERIELLTVDKATGGRITAQLMEYAMIGTTAGFQYYVKIIKQDSQRRKLQLLIDDIRKDIQTGRDIQQVLHESGKRIDEINEVIDDKPYSLVGDKVAEVATRLLEKEPNTRGIPTYLTKLDDNLGCIEESDFWVIAGRPGMGKTAMALSMAYQQARNGYHIGIITMDMSEERLIRRLLCHERDANLSLLLKATAGVTEARKITEGAQRLKELPIYIADYGALSVALLEVITRQLVKKEGVDIIYIDYLQQIKAEGGTREQEVAKASSTIKALCKDLNVPIVALAQLNRAVEGRPDKTPKLSDLRESGQLEQDAEVILFPYREAVYDDKSNNEGKAKIIFGKTRDSGAYGNHVNVAFIKESMRFADLYEN